MATAPSTDSAPARGGGSGHRVVIVAGGSASLSEVRALRHHPIGPTLVERRKDLSFGSVDGP